MTNTNLHPYAPFLSYYRLLVKFPLSTERYTLVQGEPLNSEPRNLASRN